MAFRLPDLPYSLDALEPHITRKTLHYHYGKHHQAYIDKLNDNIAGTKYASLKLEDIVRESKNNGDQDVFNNAAQAWNHDFLWKSMSPDGGGRPQGKLADMISEKFGGIDEFAESFRNAATGEFGSGWTWLILQGDALSLMSSSDAETPVVGADKPLLTLDVWEHAYYLDYQNERGAYVDAFLEHLINWDFASKNLGER